MVLQPMSKIKEEEREFGAFFEDEYNHLQHLKDRSQVKHDWSEADRSVVSHRFVRGGRSLAERTCRTSHVLGASRCSAAQCRGCKHIVIYPSGARRRQWVSSSRPCPGVST